MDKREELIKELRDKCSDMSIWLLDAEKVADFIIADRKRIVEPLVNIPNGSRGRVIANMERAIDETLRRSGL